MTRSELDTHQRVHVHRRRDPRPYFSLLERHAPGLGARVAEQVWFTLPRSRRTPPAGAPGGRRFSVPAEVAVVSGEVWGAGPVVYLVHGWGGSRGQFGAFVPALVAAGFRVVAFDAPSHGDSKPGRYGRRSSTVLEFASALRAVAELHGPPHGIVAHSLGGLATAVALRDGLVPRRVVLLAPVASMLGFVSLLRDTLGFGVRTHRQLLIRAQRRVGVSMAEFEAATMVSGGVVPAILVVHDRNDATIPASDGVALAAAWPGAGLHLTEGLGHHRLLGDRTVVEEAVRFVNG